MGEKTKDKLKLISSMTIFGTVGVVRRYIPYPSSLIAMLRGFIGVVFLIILKIIRRERPDYAGIKKNLPLLCVSGVLLGVNWILLFEAYRFTTISAATVCYYMAPVFTVLASPLILREKLSVKKGLCAIAAVGGMVLVSGVIEAGLGGVKGAVLALCAAVLYASIVLINKTISDLPAVDRTMVQLGICAMALLPYVLLTESLSGLDTGWFVLLMMAVAGIVHTGLAYTLYFGSIKTISAQTAALMSYIDPVVAVLLSVTVLHESMTAASAVGAAVVIGAMIISELPEKKRQTA